MKEIISRPRFKITVCLIGIMVAITLAASMPPLTNKSVVSGQPAPNAVAGLSIRAGVPKNGVSLAGSSGSESTQPSTYSMQGSTPAAAPMTPTSTPSPLPVPATITPAIYKCPMFMGAEPVESNYCGPYCPDDFRACGCGRGVDMMCMPPE